MPCVSVLVVGAMAQPPRRRARRPGRCGGAWLERLDVRGVRVLRAVLRVVADLGALAQRPEAAAHDAAVVDEDVLALVVGRDEPEALVVAEPLDGSGGHGVPPGSCVQTKRGRCGRQLLRNAGTALPGALARHGISQPSAVAYAGGTESS